MRAGRNQLEGQVGIESHQSREPTRRVLLAGSFTFWAWSADGRWQLAERDTLSAQGPQGPRLKVYSREPCKMYVIVGGGIAILRIGLSRDVLRIASANIQ